MVENKYKNCYMLKNDDEYYTLAKDIEHFLNNVNIPLNKVIWLPFDTEQSNFYKVLKNRGYQVINSHINTGQDFYTYEPKEHYDLILSNPPFNNKVNLLKRLIELNKPFGLMFGSQCFNTSRFNQHLKLLTKPQFIILEHRIKYTKDINVNDPKKLSNPTFNTIWICNNLLEKDIMIF